MKSLSLLRERLGEGANQPFILKAISTCIIDLLAIQAIANCVLADYNALENWFLEKQVSLCQREIPRRMTLVR